MGPAASQQLERLRALLTEIQGRNPFYTRKFRDAGCTGLPTSLADFQERYPFTIKSELVADQALHPPYGSHLTYPADQYTRCHQTSGTSGTPLRWLDTAESWTAMTEDWAEVFRAAGVRRGDRVMFAFSFGPFLGFWLAFEAAQTLGCLCFAGGGMSSALRARVLFENHCGVLCCTPTYAMHLAEVATAEGLDPRQSGVRLLVVAGEPGGSLPSTRARLSEAWGGARVFDHHGMTEVGPVTYEDPDLPGSLVVMEQSFFAECIDPTSTEPVPLGTVGELVLTTLRRTSNPLIRYRTGDLVRMRRTEFRLMLDGGILGRADDMVIVRGVNVYPSAIDDLVRRVRGVGEYRVTYDTRNALAELAIEVEGASEAARELELLLKDSLALRVPVRSVAGGSLPRSELKARRWVRI